MDDDRRKRRRDFDRERAENAGWRHLYKLAAWEKLRRWRLDIEPLCRFCALIGIVRAARVVDHITPHKGDRSLFLDPENTQSLCKRCHDSHKQREEITGYSSEVEASGDMAGWPVDPRHPANE